jgi:outer membrane receptor protein involved in Fe transport
MINAGEVRNRGVEMMLNATPVKSKDFSWNVSANWSLNRNKKYFHFLLNFREGLIPCQVLEESYFTML